MPWNGSIRKASQDAQTSTRDEDGLQDCIWYIARQTPYCSVIVKSTMHHMLKMYNPAAVMRLDFHWVVHLVRKTAGSTTVLWYGYASMPWKKRVLSFTCTPV